jgi:putative transposase
VSDRSANAVSFTRTLRLKVRAEAYSWLNAAAIEVNAVWNWANATSVDAADRNRRANAKFLSGFDLNNLSAGASEYFERIGADTIQRINCEYAQKRRQFKKYKLRWRVSRGARRSLGWVPFKAASLKRRGDALRFAGKTFRVFDREYLADHKFRDGCFAQDAVGDWYLCVPVEIQAEQSAAPNAAVGIDLGLKTIATTSDGETLEAGRWTIGHADRLAQAQRRGHKRQAKRIHRKIANRRKDALHKFSRKIVDQYQMVVVGDVSSLKLAKTKMAKSVLDSGWGTLKGFLDYKSQSAARSFQVVNERNTTRTCSSCGALTGPTGLDMLVVRRWECSECGVTHDRDVNAARNILIVGSRCRTFVSGNESSDLPVPSSRLRKRRRETGTETARTAA